MLEEIVLESNIGGTPLLTPPSPDIRSVNQQLLCEGQKRNIVLQIFNGAYVEQEIVDHKKAKRNKTIALHCAFLDSTPHHALHASLLYLILGSVSLFALAILTLLPENILPPLIRYTSIGASVMMGAFFTFLFIKDFYRITRFTSRTAGAPIISIPHKGVDKKALKQFIKSLQEVIEQQNNTKGINVKAEEMKLLRSFSETNWIKKADYEQYREKIMKSYSKK